MSDLGPKFFTVTDLAEEIGVTKGYVSRRARSGKDVRGCPVTEWAINESFHSWELGSSADIYGFRVPRGWLDEDGLPKAEQPGDSRSRIAADPPDDEPRRDDSPRSRIDANQKPPEAEDSQGDEAEEPRELILESTQAETEEVESEDTKRERAPLSGALKVLGGSIAGALLLEALSSSSRNQSETGVSDVSGTLGRCVRDPI